MSKEIIILSVTSLLLLIIAITFIILWYKCTNNNSTTKSANTLFSKLTNKLANTLSHNKSNQNTVHFMTSYPLGSSEPIIKSFGTVLVSHPIVKQIAAGFRLSPQEPMRKLPSSFPSDNFNSSSWHKYRSLLSPIGNQGNCGSCWAWASSRTLGDRFRLLSLGKIKPILSPGRMVICSFHFEGISTQKMKQIWTHPRRANPAHHAEIGCNGNDLYSSANALYAFGTTDESCVPYSSMNYPDIKTKYDLSVSNDPANIPYCVNLMGQNFDICADQKTAGRFYRSNDVYAIESDEQKIMIDIYRWGPVCAGFAVYESFITKYDGKTIYMGPLKGEQMMGGHAIRIVGWGRENNVDYWWIANSWGEKWGTSGYFRMKRMIPECQLEQNVVSMKPQFPGMTLWPVSLASVGKNALQWRQNPYHLYDPISMYYEDDVKLIKEGKLKGDLTPIITDKELPYGGKFENFWISDHV